MSRLPSIRTGLGVMAAMLTWALLSPAHSQAIEHKPERVKALIIGIANYPKLDEQDRERPRTAADAMRFAELLKELGVPDRNMTLLINANASRDAVEKAWHNHTRNRLSRDDTSIFFFSGHGNEVNKEPYLLPVDYDTRRSPVEGGLSLVDIVNRLRNERRNNLAIFIVNVCRTDATSGSSRSGGNREVANFWTSAGLPPMRAPEGTFIFYAASSQQIALHDTGSDDVSAYTVYPRVFFDLIKNKNLSLHEIAKVVRWKTYELAVGHRPQPHLQVPTEFEDVLHRRNILGTNLPQLTVSPEIGREPGKLSGAAGLGMRLTTGNEHTWACGDCPEMIAIDPVNVPMTALAEGDRQASTPATVTLGRFAIGRYEVTRDEWRACQLTSGKVRCRMIDASIVAGDRRPMANVTRADALTFVAWLNEISGTTAFRLPSEAEWKHAARGGSSSEYGPAASVRQLCDYANGADASLKTVLWANISCDDGKGRNVTTVGSYLPNGYGLHDMQGNVWEWVQDCYQTAVATGAGPETCKLGIVKGGSWRSGPDALQIDAFETPPADSGRSTVGFRVARDLDK